MISFNPAIGFASDNNSGVHPLVMENLRRINTGHVVGYGHDDYTAQVCELLKQKSGAVAAHLMYLGTAANVLCISHALRPYQAVICAQGAHIDVDECGAPEHFSGNKLLVIPTENGKILPEDLVPYIGYKGLDYKVQPKMVSVSNPNEWGLVYSPKELKELSKFCKQNDWYFHIDGARIANACAFYELDLSAMTAEVGADLVSFGGTKNGLMGAEAVLIFNPDLAKDFVFTQKQGMQLASKMRFIAAQFEAYLENDLWLELARRTNGFAKELTDKICRFKGIRPYVVPQSNAVFLQMPRYLIDELQKEFFFYVWNEELNIIRLVCSWDTTEEDINLFASKVAESAAFGPPKILD